jgi:hypothetical protein
MTCHPTKGSGVKVGDVIREKQHNGTTREVVAVVEGQYVMARGVDSGKVTRISWRNLNRYSVGREAA